MGLERVITIKRQIRLKVWRSKKKLGPKILLLFIKLVMDDEHVNLWIHHGGKWDCPKKKKQYLGGEVKIMENVDIDFLSKFEFEGYAQDLGYINGVDMWFRRFSEMCGPVSLQQIGCDKDVKDMLVCKIMDPHIDVYFVSKSSK
ncbi:unnamed protein product, partial [Cuscuta epithymum]